MDGVSIHPVTTKIQASFPTQLPERKETAQGFYHEANGDFKTVTEFNGCDRRGFNYLSCVTPVEGVSGMPLEHEPCAPFKASSKQSDVGQI